MAKNLVAGETTKITESGSNISVELNDTMKNKINSIPSISIGTTTTGEAGTDASVSNSGTATNMILNFTIPKGANGQDGQDGADGTNGADGEDGITPHIGENGNWYLGETDTGKPSRGEQGPQGIQGEQGLQGLKGDTGEAGPQGPAGADGTDGTDGITPTIGENGNWYLGKTDTGKPSKGEQGPQGPKGDQGEQGPQGEAGQPGSDGEDGQDGVGFTTASAGTPTQSDGYTVTPITFNKTDGSNVVVNVSAKNGADGSGGTGGTTDYSELENKPKINNVELNGNKTLSELGVQQTYIGTTEPTDDSVKVWINPNGSNGEWSLIETFEADGVNGVFEKTNINLKKAIVSIDAKIGTTSKTMYLRIKTGNDIDYLRCGYISGVVNTQKEYITTVEIETQPFVIITARTCSKADTSSFNIINVSLPNNFEKKGNIKAISIGHSSEEFVPPAGTIINIYGVEGE